VAVQRFCKPKVGGSNPSPGTIFITIFMSGTMSGAVQAMSEDLWSKWAGRSQMLGACALAVAFFYLLAGSTVGAAQVAGAENSYNDQLMRLPPQERAAKLANHLGVWCIGTQPFFMGMTKGGAAKGYAYWSLTCAGSGSYMIQITPAGQGAAVDCRTLKEGGEGRECYKTF
jgi:hypothetical protein